VILAAKSLSLSHQFSSLSKLIFYSIHNQLFSHVHVISDGSLVDYEFMSLPCESSLINGSNCVP